jgi:hypothetical protein
LICSESVSLNGEALEAANETQMREFLDDAYTFATSFTFPKKPIGDDVEMKSEEHT